MFTRKKHDISFLSDFLGTANITQDRKDHSLQYDTPVDCVWTIRAEIGFQIYIQFMEYELEHPNDCHTNYIQVCKISNIFCQQ